MQALGGALPLGSGPPGCLPFAPNVAGSAPPASGGGTGTSGGVSWGQMTHVTLPTSTESPPLLAHGSRLGAGVDGNLLLPPEGLPDPGDLPAMLLDTDLQAAAAVWDEGQRHQLPGGPEGQLELAEGVAGLEGLLERRQQRRRQPSMRLR